MYTSLVWAIMIGRLRQFGQRGYGWLGTTPRGRNWLWQVFVRDATDDMFVTQVTSKENYFQDSEIVKGWERLYVGDFARQELEGEFVAFTGLIYPEFSRLKHIVSELPENIVYTAAGVDWGFANPGVIEVAGIDGDGRMTLVEERYAPGLRIGEWVEIGLQMRERWNVKTFYCDPSEPDYIKAFEEAGLNAVPANNSVNTGIQAVKARLAGHEPRLLVYSAVVHFPDEVEQYVWATNQHGIKDMPVKAKDHTPDAVRYLVMGIDYSNEITLSQDRRNYIGYNRDNDNGKHKKRGIRKGWDR
jgi:phage terminase large subunit